MPRSVWLILLLLFTTPSAHAHPADEARQASAEITIDDQAVQMIVRIPVRYACEALFDGASPIDLDKLEPEELKRRLDSAVAGRNPVAIDGVAVRPVILMAQIDMTNSRLPARMFDEEQVLRSGNLLYVARYETKGRPRRVSVTWNTYATQYDALGQPMRFEEAPPVVASLNVDETLTLIVFSPNEPEYIWHGAGAAEAPASLVIPSDQSAAPQVRVLPVLSIGLLLVVGLLMLFVKPAATRGVVIAVGIGLSAGAFALPFGKLHIASAPPTIERPADAEALAIFESLHRNIYRAFDYTDEGAIYDALAQSVDGPLLESIYADVYQSLILRDEGGAVCKVQDVEIQDAEVLVPDDSDKAFEGGAYRVKCAWTVDGLVQHYGHTHARTNAFQAVYTVAPRGGQWRIVAADVTEQERIDDGKQTVEDLFGVAGGPAPSIKEE